MSSSSFYHIIFRPPLEDLPSLEDMLSSIKKTKDLVNYIIGCEKGLSNGDEKFNHYDIVLELKTDRRADTIRRALINNHKIPKEHCRNIKCYSVEEKRIFYQIGYAIKECIKYETSFNNNIIEQGIEEYKKIGTMKSENFKKDSWNVDDVGREYRNWLKSTRDFSTEAIITREMAEHYFEKFIRTNRDNIKLSVFNKINMEKTCIYVSDM